MSDADRTSLERLLLSVAALLISTGIMWGASTLSDLAEQVGRIEERLASMEGARESLARRVADHETRIRRLEGL